MADGSNPVIPGNTPEEIEHNKQMLDLNGGNLSVDPTGTQSPVEPVLLAGKYKSEDELTKGLLELAKLKYGGDLEKAYKGLETLQNPQKTPAKAELPKLDESNHSEASNTLETAIDTILADRPDGVLTEDDLKTLESKGISRTLANYYVKGIQAQLQQQVSTMYDIVGGQQNYEAITTWANSNMSLEDRQAFNSVLSTGDMSQIKFAIKALQADYMNGNPSGPRVVNGAPTGDIGGEAFVDQKQIIQAISDPRYSYDPNYRDMVAKKILRSQVI